MKGFILGSKEDQSQQFNSQGIRIPVTFIKTTPCYLVNIRTTNNYLFFKLGFGMIKNIKKPVKGELDKAGIKTPLRFFKEFKAKSNEFKIIEENNKKGIEIEGKKIFVGDEVSSELFFKQGDKVIVSGISKGKGFHGVVKRHGFKGGPRTHGQSHGERAPGSIGMTTTPGRVFKGKRMAGRMGGKRVTIKNLEVVEVKKDGLLIKGLVPGAKKELLEIKI